MSQAAIIFTTANKIGTGTEYGLYMLLYIVGIFYLYLFITVNLEIMNVAKILTIALIVFLTGGLIYALWPSSKKTAPEGAKKETIKESPATTPASVNQGIIEPYGSTKHTISLSEIGITATFNKEGDGGVLLVNLIGTPGKEGEWRVTGKERVLTSDEIKKLEVMAYAKTFSYPRELIPSSAPAIPKSIFPLYNTLRWYARSAAVTAQDLEQKRNKASAEKLMQAVLTIGRRIEEQEYGTSLTWLVGASLEQVAVESLEEYYQRNSMPDMFQRVHRYGSETMRIKNEVVGKYISQDHVTVGLGAASMAVLQESNPNPGGRAIQEAYLQTGRPRADAMVILVKLKQLKNEPIIQIEAIYPLMLYATSDKIQTEQKTAKAILEQYTKDPNIHVRTLSSSALRVSHEEVMQSLPPDTPGGDAEPNEY